MNGPLWALFASSFLSATVLPGNSEVVLFAVLNAGAVSLAPAVTVATVGNTLGGLSTYLMGRFAFRGVPDGPTVTWLRRYGALVLVLAWLPVVGDALCAAAGWLRVSWIWCSVAMLVGRLARYLVVAKLAVML